MNTGCYASGDGVARGRCLAIAPIRRDLGASGRFFGNRARRDFSRLWCVPCMRHRVSERWHLYFTRRGHEGEGLQSFRGWFGQSAMIC